MSATAGDKIIFTKEVEDFNIKVGDTGEVIDIVNLSIGLTLYFVEVDIRSHLSKEEIQTELLERFKKIATRRKEELQAEIEKETSAYVLDNKEKLMPKQIYVTSNNCFRLIQAKETIKEFDVVVITKDIEPAKAGTVGTALDLLKDGRVWLVEISREGFPKSFDGLVAVAAENLVPVKTIKFMNDYGYTSLWQTSHGRVGSIEYDELPLSKELIDLLEKRDKRYDNHLNWADPAATLPATEEGLKAFEAEGIMLWKKLQEELKPYYVVTFFSNILGRAVETEEELSK